MRTADTSVKWPGPIGGPGAPWLRYREMFLALVSRDLRSRYKGSILGFAWTLLNPLLLLIVYTLLFSVIIRLQIPHYALFLLSALLPWLWLQGALSYAANSIPANGSLIRRVAFPTEILPAVAVTTHGIHFVLALPLLFLFLVFSGFYPGPPLLVLPVLMLLQFTLALGLGLALAAANTYLRDVEHSLPFLLMVWMYLTPVLYGEWMVPPRFHFISWFNPMTPLIVAYRNVLFHGNWPEWRGLVIAALWALGALALGWTVFGRLKYRFAEVV